MIHVRKPRASKHTSTMIIITQKNMVEYGKRYEYYMNEWLMNSKSEASNFPMRHG